MAVQNDNGYKSFLTSEAVTAYRVVVLDAAGTVSPLDAVGEIPLGVTQHDAGSGEHVTVKLMSAPGTFKVTAKSSWSAAAGGVPLYLHTDEGKVDDADPSSGYIAFRALEAATGDGSIVEAVVVPYKYQ